MSDEKPMNENEIAAAAERVGRMKAITGDDHWQQCKEIYRDVVPGNLSPRDLQHAIEKQAEADLESIVDFALQHLDRERDDDAAVDADKKIRGVIELLIEHSSLQSLLPIPKIKPSHGNCCTCQDCGYSHDECVCISNEIAAKIAALGITINEGA